MIKKIVAAMLALFVAVAFAAVDANKATQAELETIKGVGPAISGKILDERKKASFKDWQDMIDRVKGVGEGNAAKFSTEGLTVNGASFAGAPAKAAAATAKKDEKPAAGATKVVAPAVGAVPSAKTETAKVVAPVASPSPATKAEAKPAAMSADDKKAAKAASAPEAKSAKADKADKADKTAAAKPTAQNKPAAAAAPASAAKK